MATQHTNIYSGHNIIFCTVVGTPTSDTEILGSKYLGSEIIRRHFDFEDSFPSPFRATRRPPSTVTYFVIRYFLRILRQHEQCRPCSMGQKLFLVSCLPLGQRTLFQYSTTRLRCCCSASNSLQTQRLHCYLQRRGRNYIDRSKAADLIRNIVTRCQDTPHKNENSQRGIYPISNVTKKEGNKKGTISEM
jgi:hypothetical protein